MTNLIWKGASIKSFLLFSQPLSARSDAWKTITELLSSGRIVPFVSKTFPLEDAANAIRHLIEGRPLTITARFRQILRRLQREPFSLCIHYEAITRRAMRLA